MGTPTTTNMSQQPTTNNNLGSEATNPGNAAPAQQQQQQQPSAVTGDQQSAPHQALEAMSLDNGQAPAAPSNGNATPTPGLGAYASAHASLEELALASCWKWVAIIEERIRFWSQLDLATPAASKEQLDEARRLVVEAQTELASRRPVWRVQFPNNSELRGFVPEDTPNAACVASSSSSAPEVTRQVVLPVPRDLPYLHVPGSKSTDARAKVLFPSADAWAYAFATSIETIGLSLEEHYWRLLMQALDRAQHDQMEKELAKFFKCNPTKERTWEITRAILVQLFDTAVQKDAS